MPAVALAPALEAIIWALFGIIAVAVLRQLIVSPIYGAANAVSGVPAIGGALAWVVWHIANAIDIGLGGLWWIADKGRQDAQWWWNYLVTGTVNAFYWQWGATVQWVNQYAGAISAVINGWPAIWNQSWATLPSWIARIGNDLVGLHSWIDNTLAPGIDRLARDLSGLTGLINGMVIPWIRTIGDDLAGLHRWIDANVVQHGELAQAEANSFARAQALVVPVVAAITAIENSPCMKVCNPLGEVGQLLQGLEDAGMLAILLALIAETRSDPQAVQDGLRSVVVPIVTDAVSSLGLG